MKTLLMIYDSQTGRTHKLIHAAHEGACAAAEGMDVLLKCAHEVDVDVLRQADAWLLATPENFGYMSGELKAMFDRTYDAVRETTAGRSYALLVSCGNDGRGAQSAVERIMLGYGMHRARETLIVRGEVSEADVLAAHELGQYMAVALSMGLI